MGKENTFQPDWIEKPPEKGSYRSIFKFGDPNGFKHPNKRLFEEVKATFNLTDQDFLKKETEGEGQVNFSLPSNLEEKHIEYFTQVSGKENVSIEEYDRLKYSTGQTVEEAMKLRREVIGKICDIVIHPRNKHEVQEVVSYCNKNQIPIYIYGGGSSVNFGLLPEKGGVTMVLSTHLNKVLEVNELNQTATVEAGIFGPAFEEALNSAPEKFGVKKQFTCGHFPQSFEYSSVGGWVVTLGSGQQSSYYGDAIDMVLGIEVITPKGTIKTYDFPATATGPKVLDILKGSEGTLGVVVEVTWKIFRFMPGNRKYFGFIFPSWEAAVNAGREISQSEFGMPAVFRISDPEETHIGLKLYGIEGTILDKLMTMRGFKPMERCLFLGTADGEKNFTKNIKKKVRKICRRHGAIYLTVYPAKKWEPGRYRDPYLREDLMDYGILIDTLETSVKWDTLHKVHTKVREVIKSRSQTICMIHASHFYPQGTNLYFIFIIKESNLEDYVAFHKKVIEAIVDAGGTLSHHHGVGKLFAPWMEAHLGKNQLDILKAIKKYIDPNNIMNPGGQLGLD